MNTELQFDAEAHRYSFRGREVPGVTDVLAPLNDFGAVPRKILEAAARFGRHVHSACDFWNRGILDWEWLDMALRPWVETYKRFLSETGFLVTQSESIVFNEQLFYAGTCDIVGMWQNTSWVVDLKTGLVPLSTGPQLAAYQRALDPTPKRLLCVQLKEDDYLLHPYSQSTRDFGIFQNCLNIWNYKHEH